MSIGGSAGICDFGRDEIIAQIEDQFLTRAPELDRVVVQCLNDGMIPPELVGCWQHFLFSRALWRRREHGRDASDEVTAAQSLLDSGDLQQELARYYELNGKVSLSGSEVHRVGSTSIILRLPEGDNTVTPERALKLVRPEYKSAPSVTAELKAFMSRVPTHTYRFVPAVYIRTPSWVLMDFIEGPTLDEELDTAMAMDSPTLAIAWLADEFIGRVRAPLKVLASRGIAHLDLTFENMIRDSRYGTPDIALIDFRSAPEVGEPRGPCVAPETARRDPQGWRSDLFSVAAMAREALGRIGRAPGESRDQLDFVRLNSPPLAFKLEVLLNENPSQRVAASGGADAVEEALTGLQGALHEFRYVGPPTVLGELWRFAQEFLTFQYWRSTLGRLLAAGRSIGEDGRARGRKHWLDAFAFLNQLAYPSVLLFVFVPAIAKWTRERIFIEHLPAFAVAASFLLVAQRYYADILRDLWLWRCDRVGGFTIRALAAFHVIPIIGAIYSTERTWAMWAALGTLAVAFGNWRAYRVCLEASQVIGAGGYLVPRPRDFGGSEGGFVKRFGNWGWAMFVYSLCLFVCGILLHRGVLHDERAYAVTIMVINAWLFIYNCTSWARFVRGNIAWAFAHMDRVAEYKIKSRGAPAM